MLGEKMLWKNFDYLLSVQLLLPHSLKILVYIIIEYQYDENFYYNKNQDTRKVRNVIHLKYLTVTEYRSNFSILENAAYFIHRKEIK